VAESSFGTGTALRSPEAFEAASAFVKPEDIRDFVRISSRLEVHCRWLQEDLDTGFEELHLHNVNRRQRPFIDDFGKGVLPELLRGATRQ
jgi:coenzyme F420-dependent glucose-6-phosphate dehydrogenase